MLLYHWARNISYSGSCLRHTHQHLGSLFLSHPSVRSEKTPSNWESICNDLISQFQIVWRLCVIVDIGKWWENSKLKLWDKISLSGPLRVEGKYSDKTSPSPNINTEKFINHIRGTEGKYYYIILILILVSLATVVFDSIVFYRGF